MASQRSRQVAELLAGGLGVLDREDGLDLHQQGFLGGQVGDLLLVLLGLDRVAGAEEGVLGAAEPGPELVVHLARRGAGGLPLAHQVAEAARGRTPVGGRGQPLGLGGEPLLHHGGLVALGGQLGEVLLAVPGVRRPCGGEPVPQLVVARLVEPGERLPLVQQFAQAGDAVPPVGAGGDRLGLGGDLGLRVAGFLDLGGAFGLALLALLGDQRGEGLQPGPQAVQVADGLGLVDRAGHLLDRGAGVVGDTVPAWTRFSSRSTSKARASYRRV